jgi:hypothetical protein
MLCCGNCFGDKGLAWIIKEKSVRVGTCRFCRSKKVPLVRPADLREYFDLVLGAYGTSTGSDACDIQSLFRQDWGLFQSLGTKMAHSLINAIYGDGNIPAAKYIVSFR